MAASSVEARLCAYFKDDPEDERDPTEAMWLEGDSLAPYIVTPMRNCIRALEMAGVREADCVADIGCGDGRVVVRHITREVAAAALHGCRGFGVEIDGYAIKVMRAALDHWRADVGDRVELVAGDATQTDFSRATVVFCSMLPDGMEALEGILAAALGRGSRVVCLHWPLGGRDPDETDAELRLYLYRGEKKGGGGSAGGEGGAGAGGGAGGDASGAAAAGRDG